MIEKDDSSKTFSKIDCIPNMDVWKIEIQTLTESQ